MEVTAACRDTKLEKSTHLPHCRFSTLLWMTLTTLVVGYHPCCGSPPFFSTTLSVFLFVKKICQRITATPLYSPAIIIEKVNSSSMMQRRDAWVTSRGCISLALCCAHLTHPGERCTISHIQGRDAQSHTSRGDAQINLKRKAELHKYV